MAFTDITQADLVNKGVVGLPDVPNLNTLEMQEKLDEIALDVIVPKFNALVEELMAKEATSSIGSETGSVSYHFEQTSLTLPAHYASTLKELLLIILSELEQVDLKAHEHENAEELDEISSTFLANTEGVIELLYNITGVTDTVSSSEHLLPTCKAIVDYIQGLGGGDMLKSVYDANDDGVADVSVEELTDYDGATPSDGQVLTYDDGEWGPKTPVSSFSGASDTNIVSPTDGQIPIYDSGTGKWENKSPESTLANTAKPIQSNIVRGMASDVIETLGSGASKSYAAGDPVLCSNGKWYIAGTDISQGTTLSNGGNLDESSQREIYTNLTQNKIGKFSDATYVPVDSIAYDETNQVLGLKVDGADTVIPFSKGVNFTHFIGIGNQNWSGNSYTYNCGFRPKLIIIQPQMAQYLITNYYNGAYHEDKIAYSNNGFQTYSEFNLTITDSGFTINGSWGGGSYTMFGAVAG